MEKYRPPIGDILAASGVSLTELRDLSSHIRQRVGQIVKDQLVLIDNPTLMSGIAISGMAGVYDVVRSLMTVVLRHIHKMTVTEDEIGRIAAALMIVQLQSTRDGVEIAKTAFYDFLTRIGREDLAKTIILDGF